jgi:hypothetical protein
VIVLGNQEASCHPTLPRFAISGAASYTQAWNNCAGWPQATAVSGQQHFPNKLQGVDSLTSEQGRAGRWCLDDLSPNSQKSGWLRTACTAKLGGSLVLVARRARHLDFGHPSARAIR